MTSMTNDPSVMRAPVAPCGQAAPSPTRARRWGEVPAEEQRGYTLGPLLGGVLITLGGFTLLFATLAVLVLAVAGWAMLIVAAVPPLPRTRQTVLDLARRLTAGSFLRPTLTLAGATAALAVGVGFMPVAGTAAGLGSLATGATVSLLAACAALVQPWVGRARDAGRISDRTGMALGLAMAATGMVRGKWWDLWP
jgi:MFS transporter, DHA1 family, tetracycline resistance protein